MQSIPTDTLMKVEQKLKDRLSQGSLSAEQYVSELTELTYRLIRDRKHMKRGIYSPAHHGVHLDSVRELVAASLLYLHTMEG